MSGKFRKVTTPWYYLSIEVLSFLQFFVSSFLLITSLTSPTNVGGTVDARHCVFPQPSEVHYICNIFSYIANVWIGAVSIYSLIIFSWRLYGNVQNKIYFTFYIATPQNMLIIFPVSMELDYFSCLIMK